MAPVGAAVAVVSAYLNEMLREKRTLLAALEKRYGARIFSGDDEKPLKRLTVLRLDPVLTSATAFIRANNQITASNRIVLKAMDAASHLSRHGIYWVPQNNEVRVDQHGEPMIGLDMDLRKKATEKAVDVYRTQMDTVVILYENLPVWEIPQQIKEVRYRLAMGLPLMRRNNPAAASTAPAVKNAKA